MVAALIALRFVHFAAAMAAFGIGAFRVYAFAGAPAAATGAPARAALDAQFAQLMTGAATVMLVTALAIIPFVAAEMTGSAAAGFDLATDWTVMTQTAFGDIWSWHLGFGAALFAVSLMPRRRWQARVTSLAALLALTSLGWLGHAAMDMGDGPVHQINQMAHLTAAGLWLGGLLPLGMLLRRAARPEDAAYAALARIALPHFSQIGYVAVSMLLLTGTVNSVMLVGSFHALVATAYGRLLTVKIALFLAMVGLALVNRFRLLPRLRDRPLALMPLRALCRSVLTEQALGLAILAVVAVLGTWAPAMGHM